MPTIYKSNSKIKTQNSKAEKKEKEKPKVGKHKPQTETGRMLYRLLSPSDRFDGHTHNPFASYVYFPENVKFETQEKEEKVILLVRKHLVTNAVWILTASAMVLAPLVLKFFPLIEFLPGNFRFVAVLIWYMIVVAYVLESFLSWYFDAGIITDERVVDIDFHSLIYKNISDAKIDKIQDVRFNTGGVIRTLFNYGDVHIQTASEVPTFEFLAVPHPQKVVRVLQDLIIEEEQEKIEGRVH